MVLGPGENCVSCGGKWFCVTCLLVFGIVKGRRMHQPPGAWCTRAGYSDRDVTEWIYL